jgi:hypothetical protein
MYFSLLFVSTYSILLTLGAPTGDDQTQRQLTNILHKLNQVELHLNKSIIKLLEKIDNSSHDIINLIKSSQTLQTDSEFSFSNISKN